MLASCAGIGTGLLAPSCVLCMVHAWYRGRNLPACTSLAACNAGIAAAMRTQSLAAVCLLTLLLLVLVLAGSTSCGPLALLVAAAVAACRSERQNWKAAFYHKQQDPLQLGMAVLLFVVWRSTAVQANCLACTASQVLGCILHHHQQCTSTCSLPKPVLSPSLFSPCYPACRCLPAAFVLSLLLSFSLPSCRAGPRPALNAGGPPMTGGGGNTGAQKRPLDGAGGNMDQKRARMEPVVPPEQESLPQEGSSMDMEALKRRFEALQQEVCMIWTLLCGRLENSARLTGSSGLVLQSSCMTRLCTNTVAAHLHVHASVCGASLFAKAVWKAVTFGALQCVQ